MFLQASRFSARLMAEGDEVLQSLASVQLNHSNKNVRRAAGAALVAAQHEASLLPPCHTPGCALERTVPCRGDQLRRGDQLTTGQCYCD